MGNAMTDQQRQETERQFKLRQFRQIEQETTDPLARRLITDIISDLEAQASPTVGSPDKETG